MDTGFLSKAVTEAWDRLISGDGVLPCWYRQ